MASPPSHVFDVPELMTAAPSHGSGEGGGGGGGGGGNGSGGGMGTSGGGDKSAANGGESTSSVGAADSPRSFKTTFDDFGESFLSSAAPLAVVCSSWLALAVILSL